MIAVFASSAYLHCASVTKQYKPVPVKCGDALQLGR